MYSAKPSVNQLAARMTAYGVTDVVVCPGSRNAPLVNDFYELSLAHKMRVFSVTDERSAAFTAIGLYLASGQPAAVCVTSGSALLNTLPAVAEAYYRHAPLLIISADRPPEDIGQLRGQTLQQPGALQPHARTWTLAEQDAATAAKTCNEALASLWHSGGTPVHINVPLSEPLHVYASPQFDLPQPVETLLQCAPPIPDAVMQRIAEAELPAIFVGQMDFPPAELLARIAREHKAAILSEIIGCGHTAILNLFRCAVSELPHKPDLVVHLGGTAVDKRYDWIFNDGSTPVVRIEPDAAASPDTFGHHATIVHTTPEQALRQLATLPPKSFVRNLYDVVLPAFRAKHAQASHAPLMHELHELAVRCKGSVWHLGNSSAVRLFQATLADGLPHMHCNRGVNGIEGSLSVAAGNSMGTDRLVFCILGDLSFFYDSNALWNSNLRGNLRVLLLQNGGGGIFDRVRGVSESRAFPLIAARHDASAKGICESFGADYLHVVATDTNGLSTAFALLASPPDARVRPLVVECSL